MTAAKPELSVVIPVYNSEAIVPELQRRLREVLAAAVESYEVIAVVDGCGDGSFDALRACREQDPRIKIIEFSRNFGHQLAVTAGLEAAQGKLVVVMDDDLEDPPEVLPSFIAKLREGYDVVYGVRRKRKRSLAHRFLYSAFYRVLARVVEIDVPYDSGDFCIMRDSVVQTLNAMPETNRYLRGMRSWVGFRQTGLEYEREPRFAGDPGYTFRQYFRLASDGIFSFSDRPLIYVSRLGAGIAILSFMLGAALAVAKVLGRIRDVPGWASLFVSVVFLSGVQLVCLGIIGQYLGRVYDEVKRRPKYVVNRSLGVGAERDHGT